MKAKFNPKAYQGKDRVYTKVPGSARISRLWVWNANRAEYFPPENGKGFIARRYEVVQGSRKRVEQFFHSLQEAREWQDQRQATALRSEATDASLQGPLFCEVVASWKKRKFPLLAESTRIHYEKLLRLYFGSMWNFPVLAITAQTIDAWLDELKDPLGYAMQSSRRISFRHELGVLSAVLRYYDEYGENPHFKNPVKRRHWNDVQTGRKPQEKSKDLTEVEFDQFVKALRETRYGNVLAPLATVHYFQALRISEAAGLFHKDILLDRSNPANSRIRIKRYVFWPRVKGMTSSIRLGFKNSRKFPDGIKEHQMFPQAYKGLCELIQDGKAGLLFSIRDGRPIEYRTLQYYYDVAFKAAGLPYTATHILRHGWTREVYNQSLDMDASKELLGDTSDEAARRYAVRRAGSLGKIVQERWAVLTQSGCDWLRPEGVK